MELVTKSKNFPKASLHPRRVGANKLGKNMDKLGKTSLSLGKKWGMSGKKPPEKIRFTVTVQGVSLKMHCIKMEEISTRTRLDLIFQALLLLLLLLIKSAYCPP
jgi:hypothetical protein